MHEDDRPTLDYANPPADRIRLDWPAALRVHCYASYFALLLMIVTKQAVEPDKQWERLLCPLLVAPLSMPVIGSLALVVALLPPVWLRPEQAVLLTPAVSYAAVTYGLRRWSARRGRPRG